MAGYLAPNNRLLATLFLLASAALPAAAQQPDSTLDVWEVEPGFRLDIVARGFNFPTAIAFVPRPGTRPEDPRFFVAELHGTVKVVTNDGSVHTFARDFAPFKPALPQPVDIAENGTAGLCLDAATGYVFVTYVYQDSAGILRNGVTRFSSRPGTFATSETARKPLDAIFAQDVSSNSHQIGPCQVWRGHVFVAVGNALRIDVPHILRSTLGKILRFTVDGDAPRDNPFSSSTDGGAAKLVWAMGFRNVFSLKIVDGRVFAAENGLNLDRFLELEAGRDYHYNGTDWAIGMNNAMVFAPAVSPVQMDFAPADYTTFPPTHRERFFLALAGVAGAPGPSIAGERSVISLEYDLAQHIVRSLPRPLVRYTGAGMGGIVGMSLGSDGAYFAPIYPDSSGSSPVIRVSYAPDRPHSRIIGTTLTANSLLMDKGCIYCHRIGDRGGAVGPSLDQPPLRQRLTDRLGSADYRREFTASDSLNRQPFTSLASERQGVLAAPPADQPRLWLVNWLMEPRFAKPATAMPTIGLTRPEADVLADYLLSFEPEPARPAWKDRIPESRHRYTAMALVVGLGLGALAMLLLRRPRPRA